MKNRRTRADRAARAARKHGREFRWVHNYLWPRRCKRAFVAEYGTDYFRAFHPHAHRRLWRNMRILDPPRPVLESAVSGRVSGTTATSFVFGIAEPCRCPYCTKRRKTKPA